MGSLFALWAIYINMEDLQNARMIISNDLINSPISSSMQQTILFVMDINQAHNSNILDFNDISSYKQQSLIFIK